jgi:hypothetical protein
MSQCQPEYDFTAHGRALPHHPNSRIMIDPAWILVGISVIGLVLALPTFIRELRGANSISLTTIIICVLVPSSWGAASYDLYDRRYHYVIDVPAIHDYWNKCTNYSDVYRRTYSHETVLLDGLRCRECVFEDAAIQWDGTAPFQLYDSTFITPHQPTAPNEPPPRGPNVRLRTSNPIVGDTYMLINQLGGTVPGFRIQDQPWLPPPQR